ncbi:MAG: DUF4157 domain-containing protein, partial [Elusimicrobia bacterium]|nr:DUF4157 domain-containing protein [Elusimicrobiota bacterium]
EKDKLLSNACGCPPDGHKPVNGKCEPVCLGGKIWNAALKQCECPEGATLVEGKCQCPLGQIVVDKKCGCPADQTLTAEGKCACADKDKVPTITEKCEPKDSKKGRSLTFEEMETAKKIFGDKIDYRKVKLITTGKGNPHTSGDTIYFPGYQSNQSFDQAALMHEITHVYQSENYKWWEYYPEKAADWFNGLTVSKYLFGTDPYAHELIYGKSFYDYGLDQQATIIWEYYYEQRYPGAGIGPRDLTEEEKNIIRDMLQKAGLLQ